jgi:hypothetical protein
MKLYILYNLHDTVALFLKKKNAWGHFTKYSTERKITSMKLYILHNLHGTVALQSREKERGSMVWCHTF